MLDELNFYQLYLRFLWNKKLLKHRLNGIVLVWDTVSQTIVIGSCPLMQMTYSTHVPFGYLFLRGDNFIMISQTDLSQKGRLCPSQESLISRWRNNLHGVCTMFSTRIFFTLRPALWAQRNMTRRLGFDSTNSFRGSNLDKMTTGTI